MRDGTPSGVPEANAREVCAVRAPGSFPCARRVHGRHGRRRRARSPSHISESAGKCRTVIGRRGCNLEKRMGNSMRKTCGPPAGAGPDFRPESLVVVATVFRRRGPIVGCSPSAGQMRRARGVGAREEFVSEVLRGASTSRGTRAVSSVRRPPRSGPAVSPVSAARAPASSRWEVTRSALFPRDAPARARGSLAPDNPS